MSVSEMIRSIVEKKAPMPGVAQLIGFEFVEAASGRAAVELEVGPQHHNFVGWIHGGVLCDLADLAMAFAFGSVRPPNEGYTTVELKMNYFRPVKEGLLRAEAKIVNQGRNLGYLECDIRDREGRLVARSASTCMILRVNAEAAKQG